MPQGGTIMIEGRIDDESKTGKGGDTQTSAAIEKDNQQTGLSDKLRCITINITNPMPEFSRATQRESNKMAQENVRLRLEALYDGKGKLSVENKDNIYRTTIRFPYLRERLKERS